jgi:hypothetical protein
MGTGRRNVSCERSGTDEDVVQEVVELCKSAVLETLSRNVLAVLTDESLVEKILVSDSNSIS